MIQQDKNEIKFMYLDSNLGLLFKQGVGFKFNQKPDTFYDSQGIQDLLDGIQELPGEWHFTIGNYTGKHFHKDTLEELGEDVWVNERHPDNKNLLQTQPFESLEDAARLLEAVDTDVQISVHYMPHKVEGWMGFYVANIHLYHDENPSIQTQSSRSINAPGLSGEYVLNDDLEPDNFNSHDFNGDMGYLIVLDHFIKSAKTAFKEPSSMLDGQIRIEPGYGFAFDWGASIELDKKPSTFHSQEGIQDLMDEIQSLPGEWKFEVSSNGPYHKDTLERLPHEVYEESHPEYGNVLESQPFENLSDAARLLKDTDHSVEINVSYMPHKVEGWEGYRMASIHLGADQRPVLSIWALSARYAERMETPEPDAPNVAEFNDKFTNPDLGDIILYDHFKKSEYNDKLIVFPENVLE
jgi:hypothetical protein